MTEEKKQPVTPEDPKQAEPGRGAPGNAHYGVQMAQNPEVNPPSERIPSQEDVVENVAQVKALEEQEEKQAGVHTTDGYTISESGQLNNVAVEPEMRVEE